MDEQIYLLNENTDTATKQMLQNVIDRKRKYDVTEKRLKTSRIMTSAVSGLFIFYIWFFILRPTDFSFSTSISIILDNMMYLYILLLIGVGISSIKYFDTKKEKVEKEYHDLRCEIVKRSTDLWPQPEKWDHRLEVFKMMKSEYDINLYHESK